MKKYKTEWVLCPVCGNKTRTQIREDIKNLQTQMCKNSEERSNFPFVGQTYIIKEPDARRRADDL